MKAEETPSHGGGLSDLARQRLEARRRERNKPQTQTSAAVPKREERRGFGDFQEKLNKGSWQDRDRDRGYDRRDRDRGYDRDRGDRRGDRDYDRSGSGSWDNDSESRSDRRYDGGSIRVPNRRWDDTPGGRRGLDGPGSAGRSRGWDETPSRSREDSPEFKVDAKEWEEEQIRLDRDWYNFDDEGAVAGDEENNPFAQWSNLEQGKEAEMEQKVAKRQTARQAQYVSTPAVRLLTDIRMPIRINGRPTECSHLVS